MAWFNRAHATVDKMWQAAAWTAAALALVVAAALAVLAWASVSALFRGPRRRTPHAPSQLLLRPRTDRSRTLIVLGSGARPCAAIGASHGIPRLNWKRGGGGKGTM